MGLCFVSRMLGLQRIDGCRSDPKGGRGVGGPGRGASDRFGRGRGELNKTRRP